MQLVEVTGININSKAKYKIELKGNNTKGYRAFVKNENRWTSYVMLPRTEFKLIHRLFDGTNTDLYHLNKEHPVEYTAIKNYYIKLEYKGEMKE